MSGNRKPVSFVVAAAVSILGLASLNVVDLNAATSSAPKSARGTAAEALDPNLVLGNQSWSRRRASTGCAHAQASLQRASIDIHDISVTGLIITVVSMKAHAGLERGNPEDFGLIPPRVGFFHSPPCQSDGGVLAADGRQG